MVDEHVCRAIHDLTHDSKLLVEQCEHTPVERRLSVDVLSKQDVRNDFTLLSVSRESIFALQ